MLETACQLRHPLKRNSASIAALVVGLTACSALGAAPALNTPENRAQPQEASMAPVIAGTPAQKPAIWRDSSDKNLVILDPSVDPPQRRVIWISLGSMTIETIEVNGNELVFDYIPEVEMGWEKRRCTVPRDQGNVTFAITRNGTPGKTSFDLSSCQLMDTSINHPPGQMAR